MSRLKQLSVRKQTDLACEIRQAFLTNARQVHTQLVALGYTDKFAQMLIKCWAEQTTEKPND